MLVRAACYEEPLACRRVYFLAKASPGWLCAPPQHLSDDCLRNFLCGLLVLHTKIEGVRLMQYELAGFLSGSE